MKLEAVISDVLAIPLGEVDDSLGPVRDDRWDSLKQMQLIVTLEEHYKVTFSRQDLRAMKSVGAVREVLLSKGVAA
ncbi:acyl carrier protein [Streptomyces sp. NBC_01264]|uniref:acyl carrier protein n=1 Tax=Streptomyces sp. NBC_01264 TaxID=2903804 RepID=UPI00224D1D65|nr:acyl carrier protein [Streptomyces sp. NBC_01264]MCX4783064.1 acyl carrier protein [Streptomyces sp. NBC_01264]